MIASEKGGYLLGDRTRAPQRGNHESARAGQNLLQEKTLAPAYYPPHGLSLLSPPSPDGIPLTRNNLLFLQRTTSNQAVVRLLQRKAKISQPGDEDEREADRVADQVMTATPQSARQNMAPDRQEISNTQSGEGEPLAESVRAYFEPRFGHDFSDVRVHKGSQGAESARAINARAYTTGRDVVFGANEYAPETSEGKRLLAHELTHVVQQEAAGNTTVQRQPEPEPVDQPAPESVGLPPEHPGNLAAVEEAEETLKPQREERANKQQELVQTQMSSLDPEEEEALRAREKGVRERLSQLEKDLTDGLQKKIWLIDTAIWQIEQVLPGQTGGGAPEVEQEVWDELERLRAMKKAAEKELLLLSRARKRERIKELNEAIEKLPEGSPERVAMEKESKEAAEFLSATAENRAAPGTIGPRAGESGPAYVVYRGYVKVGGNTPWRNNNPGNVQRSPSGGDPPGVLGVDKWEHYIFESYEAGQMAIYFDLVNRRGGPGASLRSVLRSYIAGNKKDEELPEKCGPGDDLAVCVTRESAQSYPGKVAGTAGLTDKLGLPIGSLDDSEKARLVDAIKTWEGGKVVKGDTYTCANAPAPYRNLLGCDE